MPVPSTSYRLLALPGLAIVALAGCATQNPCGENPEYMAAQDRPKLQVPEGCPGQRATHRRHGDPAGRPGRRAARSRPQVPRPAAAVLRQARRTAGSPEEAVYVWAAAWSNRKPDQVAAFYSPQFETTEAGGAASYIDGVRAQVATGPAAEPRLEEMKTVDAGPDRKVVTFVQRFGGDAYRKELTLARDAQGWRIVAERTLQ